MPCIALLLGVKIMATPYDKGSHTQTWNEQCVDDELEPHGHASIFIFKPLKLINV